VKITWTLLTQFVRRTQITSKMQVRIWTQTESPLLLSRSMGDDDDPLLTKDTRSPNQELDAAVTNISRVHTQPLWSQCLVDYPTAHLITSLQPGDPEMMDPMHLIGQSIISASAMEQAPAGMHPSRNGEWTPSTSDSEELLALTWQGPSKWTPIIPSLHCTPLVNSARVFIVESLDPNEDVSIKDCFLFHELFKL